LIINILTEFFSFLKPRKTTWF